MVVGFFFSCSVILFGPPNNGQVAGQIQHPPNTPPYLTKPKNEKYLHDKNTFSTAKKTRIFVIKFVEWDNNSNNKKDSTQRISVVKGYITQAYFRLCKHTLRFERVTAYFAWALTP